MIETERLKLIPLTHSQLLKYLKNDHSLEAELQLHPSSQVLALDLHLVEALENFIIPNVANPENDYRYSTLWTIVLKSKNTMVGDLCFKGAPNSFGEIEIGYGTYDTYRGKGYMTEAVHGMLKWAAEQSNVKFIIAETERENQASFKVLEKNDFQKFDESETTFWWRIDLHKN